MKFGGKLPGGCTMNYQNIFSVVPLPFYSICEFNENDICEIKDEQKQQQQKNISERE